MLRFLAVFCVLFCFVSNSLSIGKSALDYVKYYSDNVNDAANKSYMSIFYKSLVDVMLTGNATTTFSTSFPARNFGLRKARKNETYANVDVFEFMEETLANASAKTASFFGDQKDWFVGNLAYHIQYVLDNTAIARGELSLANISYHQKKVVQIIFRGIGLGRDVLAQLASKQIVHGKDSNIFKHLLEDKHFSSQLSETSQAYFGEGNEYRHYNDLGSMAKNNPINIVGNIAFADFVFYRLNELDPGVKAELEKAKCTHFSQQDLQVESSLYSKDATICTLELPSADAFTIASSQLRQAYNWRPVKKHELWLNFKLCTYPLGAVVFFKYQDARSNIFYGIYQVSTNRSNHIKSLKNWIHKVAHGVEEIYVVSLYSSGSIIKICNSLHKWFQKKPVLKSVGHCVSEGGEHKFYVPDVVKAWDHVNKKYITTTGLKMLYPYFNYNILGKTALLTTQPVSKTDMVLKTSEKIEDNRLFVYDEKHTEELLSKVLGDATIYKKPVTEQTLDLRSRRLHCYYEQSAALEYSSEGTKITKKMSWALGQLNKIETRSNSHLYVFYSGGIWECVHLCAINYTDQVVAGVHKTTQCTMSNIYNRVLKSAKLVGCWDPIKCKDYELILTTAYVSDHLHEVIGYLDLDGIDVSRVDVSYPNMYYDSKNGIFFLGRHSKYPLKIQLKPYSYLSKLWQPKSVMLYPNSDGVSVYHSDPSLSVIL